MERNKNNQMEPKIITIVGKSNSGKTTLVEKLVSGLTRKGYRIGTAKSSHCGFEIDKEGKDSRRHRQAGSVATLMITRDQTVMVRDDHRKPKDKMTSFLGDTDLIIAEGFKGQDLPKIEIFRKAGPHATPLFMENPEQYSMQLKAVVTDADITAPVPVFGLEAISELIDFIEKNLIENSWHDQKNGV